MDSPNWYIYQNAQQLGPFAKEVLLQMIETQMLRDDAYLFCVGWRDWRPFEDCRQELSTQAGPDATPQRRASAPRASISGRIIVHNNGQLTIGHGVNISGTGLFVETRDQLFQVGESLKISCRCDGIDTPFNVIAEVIRSASDIRYPIGYGLRFKNLAPKIEQKIIELVAKSNEPKARHA